LDTDAIIDVLKGIATSAAFIRNLVQDGHTLATSDVISAEVWSGLVPDERARGERFLGSLHFLTTSREAAQQAGEWRYAFRRQGRALSLPDALLAATARYYSRGEGE